MSISNFFKTLKNLSHVFSQTGHRILSFVLISREFINSKRNGRLKVNILSSIALIHKIFQRFARIF